MAAATVAIASGAVCAPLNPGYGKEEFRFYLTDLEPAALLLPAEDRGPARAVATALGIRCLDARWSSDWPAGCFEIDGGAAPACPDDDPPHPDDVALLLHTSGTTSRPKLVPLSHANLCSSACNIARTLRAFAARSLPEHNAALPHPWLRRGVARIAGRVAAASLAPPAIVTAGSCPGWRHLGPSLVHRRADRAPGDPRRVGSAPGRSGRESSALRSLLVRAAAPGGDARTRSRAACAGDRGVRDDRGGAPDGEQSVAARRAQADVGWPGRGTGVAVMDDAAALAAGGHHRRDRHPRRQRHSRLRQRSAGQC